MNRHVRRAAIVLTLIAIALLGGALAFQVLREHQYRALLARGDAAAREGQTFSAIEAYSGAIALRPDSMLAHLRRGEAYQQRGDLDAATRDIRRAAALDPTATRPPESLGDVLYQRKRWKRAADVYEARLRIDDRSVGADRVAYKLALARHRAGDQPAALAALEQALRLNDRLAEAQYLRGVCLREQHQLAAAITALEQAVAIAPDLIPAREELADAYLAMDRQTEHVEQLQLIAALDRAQVDRLVAVGLAHAGAGHTELALLTLGNVLERTADKGPVYAALGRVWLDAAATRADALSKAVGILGQAAGDPQATSGVLTLYGRSLLMANRLDDAERVLQQATTRFPVEPEAFLEYARAAELRDNLSAARSALVAYHGFADDGNATARMIRIGTMSSRLNEPAAAASWFRRAADRTPDDTQLIVQLAEEQLKAGAHAAAAATIAAGLEKDPGNAPLLRLRTRVSFFFLGRSSP